MPAVVVPVVCLLLAAVVGVFWWRAMGRRRRRAKHGDLEQHAGNGKWDSSEDPEGDDQQQQHDQQHEEDHQLALSAGSNRLFTGMADEAVVWEELPPEMVSWCGGGGR